MNRFVFTWAILLGVTGAFGQNYVIHSFKTMRLNDQFWSEGATVGDFNRDGKSDVAAGPYWYEGPDFKTLHEYYPATATFTRKYPDGTEKVIPGFEGALGVNNRYSDNFFAFTYDFNKDGWDDILIIGYPGQESAWYENPQGASGHWKKYVVLQVTDNESPTFTDLTGDGKPEIVCNSEGYFGFAEPDWSDPVKPWKFRPISPKGSWQRYTHGLGVGDVNGDGRKDIMEKDGWWEQPESLEGDPEWTHHPFTFAPGGSSQMYAYDVDGDGDNDVISCLAAHGYGLAWYEQVKKDGQITFERHILVNKEASDSKYGVKFAQPHAVDLADVDGDGLKDIVTGKRFWAHGSEGDAEPNAAAVLYWFKLVRGENGVDFVPYLIDDDSGIGTQVLAADANNDGLVDIVVGNKKGVFVSLHQTRNATREEWQKHQPKILY